MYVDDIIIIGSSNEIISMLGKILNDEFSLKYMGILYYFFGIKVNPTSTSSLLLKLSNYVKNLLTKAGMDNVKPSTTLMSSTMQLSSSDDTTCNDNPSYYRSIVGALQYTILTRPDICLSVNKACQYISNPLQTQWLDVKIFYDI